MGFEKFDQLRLNSKKIFLDCTPLVIVGCLKSICTISIHEKKNGALKELKSCDESSTHDWLFLNNLSRYKADMKKQLLKV